MRFLAYFTSAEVADRHLSSTDPRLAAAVMVALDRGDVRCDAVGFLTSPGPFQRFGFDIPVSQAGTYPPVMIPAFAVPSFILLHVLSIRQLRRGTDRSAPRSVERARKREPTRLAALANRCIAAARILSQDACSLPRRHG